MSEADIGFKSADRSFGSARQLACHIAQALHPLPDPHPLFCIVQDRWMQLQLSHEVADAFGDACLGVSFLTWPQFTEVLWALYGDGRRLVSAPLREALLARALYDEASSRGPNPQGAVLPQTPSVLSQLAKAAYCGWRFEAFEDKLRDKAGCTFAHDVLLRYSSMLENEGCIEPGQAERLLAQAGLGLCVIVVDPFGHAPSQTALLDSLDAELCRIDPRCSNAGSAPSDLASRLYSHSKPLEPNEGIRFAVSSGAHAQPSLVCELACSLARKGFSDVFIACADPCGMFRAVAPRLARVGISSRGKYSSKLCLTPFGRVLFGFMKVFARGVDLGAAPADAAAQELLIDYLSQTRQESSLDEVCALEARWLRMPRLGLAQACDCVAKLDNRIRHLVDLSVSGRIASLASKLYEAFEQTCGEEGLKASLLRASATHVFEGLATLGSIPSSDVPGGIPPVALEALGQRLVRLDLSCAAQGEVLASAAFGTIEELAARPSQAALFTQMDMDSYPLSSSGDAALSFLSHMGLSLDDERVPQARSAFRQAVANAGSLVVFQRSLCDLSGDALRPCALLDDVTDCFRDDLTRTDDMDQRTGLPLHIASAKPPIFYELGEEALDTLFAPLAPSGLIADGGQVCPTEAKGRPFAGGNLGAESSPASCEELLEAYVSDMKAFSTSQVEAYMNCPYRWFVEKVVRPDPLEPPSGSISFGDLAHSVLEGFYRAFSQDREGKPRRVCAGNLDDALSLLEEVFVRELQKASDDPKSGIDISSELDRASASRWRQMMRETVKGDCDLLESFVPSKFELGFGFHERVQYASESFCGRIDRIDLGRLGKAVIIDYKGGLGREYSPRIEQGSLQIPHVQALVYAQVARRSLGLDVCASIYRSYRKREVQGLFDSSHVVKDELLRGGAVGLGGPDGSFSFQDALDICEEQVAGALSRMRNGEIPREPAWPSSCRYCPLEKSCKV